MTGALSRGQLVSLAVILCVGLGLRSCHLANHLSGDLAAVEELFTSSDMHAFTAWARRMAAGDWLCRDTYHPYMDWMQPIAPLEQFEIWWGGKAIYHQAPLYPYLLAASYAIFASNVPLLIVQVLAAAFSVWLVFDLGRRLLDARAGLVAAALAATFAPAIVCDSILLRASLNSTLTLLAVWLLVALRRRGSIGLGIAAGVGLASGYLLRPTGAILLLLGPAVVLLDRASRPGWRRWGLGLAGAAILTFAPFVVRNAIVGAPLLAFSTRGPETILQANRAAAEAGFMSVGDPAGYRALMVSGHGSMLRALGAAIDTWPPGSQISWWLWHQGQKLLCVFGDYEYANNINFYYYRALTSGLAALPTFGWFAGAGIVGIVLLVLFGRNRVGLWLLAVAGAGLLAGCLLGFALGRYRMPLAMLLAIPAGVTVSMATRWLLARRPLPAVVVIVASASLSILSFHVLPAAAMHAPDGSLVAQPASLRRVALATTRLRPQEYLQAARARHEAGDPAGAVGLLRTYRGEVLATINTLGKAFQDQRDGFGMYNTLIAGQHAMEQIATTAGAVLRAIDFANETRAIAVRMQEQIDAMGR